MKSLTMEGLLWEQYNVWGLCFYVFLSGFERTHNATSFLLVILFYCFGSVGIGSKIWISSVF